MADYVEVEQARGMSGLRLVLTAGVPGPWGEAAKAIFRVKEVPFVRVRQAAGQPNPALREWTGRENAPIAVYEDEEPRDGWADILWLAERLGPEPALVPDDPEARARMFGLAHEICGGGGFAWQRRLMLLQPMLEADPPPPEAMAAIGRRLGNRYGYSREAAAAAPARVAATLSQLSAQLLAQRRAGSRYFIGDALTALDLYWATFAAMVEPLPDAQCPMGQPMRAGYTLRDATARAAADPILLEHRDFIYDAHLELPLDF